MNWGTKIIVAYVCFGVIIFSMVTICMKQDVSLVAKDYYKQEIAYQDQMHRIANYNKVESEFQIAYSRTHENLRLSFPIKSEQHLESGTIHFFRPSKAGMDRKIKISLDKNGSQVINLKEMSAGLWRVKLNWTIRDKEFYHEKIIVI